MKIGFFDTGLGGLSVLQAVVNELSQYDFVYCGDTKNQPYGDKTEEEIYTLTKKAVTELFKMDCALVILACNTASVETLRKMQDTFLVKEFPERRILGVVVPVIEELIERKSKKALLLATKRTVESGKYERELCKCIDASVSIYTKATPELVPLIEQGEITEAVRVAQSMIDREVSAVGEVDTVILGCTHYTKLKKALRDVYGGSIQFISQDEIIPTKLKKYLKAHPEIESKLSKTGKRFIHLTKHREDYNAVIADLLKEHSIEEE